MRHQFNSKRGTEMLPPPPVCIAIAVALTESLKRKRRQRRVWAKQWLCDRKKYSVINLLQELRTNDQSDFRNYLRMNDTLFNNHARMQSSMVSGCFRLSFFDFREISW